MAVRTEPAKRELGLDTVDAWVRVPIADGRSDLEGPMALPLALLRVAALHRTPRYRSGDQRALVVVDPQDAAAWADAHGHRVPHRT